MANHIITKSLAHCPVQTCFVLAVLVSAGTVFAANTYTERWELVFQDNFDDDSFQQRWLLDGSADLGIRAEAGNPYLQIRTRKQTKASASVLWNRNRFSGDVRITFRARGEMGNRAILYFNANLSTDSEFSSIFNWARPDADMSRYAGDDRIMMYSLGILRDDQDKCNLRFLGGPVASAYRKIIMDKQLDDRRTKFGAESIIESSPCPYKNKPETWFAFDVRIESNRLTLKVNSEQVFKINDPGNAGKDVYAWKPLTNGGWIGFRNFRATRVDIDDVKVFSRTKNY